MGEYRTTQGESPPATRRERRRTVRRWAVYTILAAVLLLTIGLGVHVRRHIPASGYVTTEPYAEVRPAVHGVVEAIFAHSGQTVQAGDLLVQLTDTELRANRQEMESRANRILAEMTRRRAQAVEEERRLAGHISAARLRLEHAAMQRGLTEELHARGLASGSALEEVRLRERLVDMELAGLLERDGELVEKELDVLRQELQAARDAIARVEAQLQRHRIRAPVAGKALRYTFSPGEIVGPDTVLYELFGTERNVLKLQVPEPFSTLVGTDAVYRARLTSYRGLRRVTFTGRVESLRDAIETRNNRTYRQATCAFEPGEYSVPPGTTAEAWIEVGRTPLWAALFGLY